MYTHVDEPQARFQDLDRHLQRLRRHFDEVGYVLLVEYGPLHGPRCRDLAGRMDVDDPKLLAWLDKDLGLEVNGDGDEAFDAAEIGAADRCEALIQWIKWTAAGRARSYGGQPARFRLRVLSPKGESGVFSGMFIVEDISPPQRRMVTLPTFDHLSKLGEFGMPVLTSTGSMRDDVEMSLGALGPLYTQFAQLVLGTMTQHHMIHQDNVSSYQRQLTDQKGTIDDLAAALVTSRFQQAEQEGNQAAEVEERKARAETAREVMSTLQKTATTFLAAKQDLSPEMAALLQQVSASPELMGAFQDPKVQALMQDPENLAVVAQMLRQASEAA